MGGGFVIFVVLVSFLQDASNNRQIAVADNDSLIFCIVIAYRKNNASIGALCGRGKALTGF